MPEINNTKEYGNCWNAWWWSMQPSWRDPESPFDMPPKFSASSWSHSLCGGPNGHFLVVLALAWWMKYGGETHLSEIKEAAIDVAWVLGELGLALDACNKRKKRELEIRASDNLPSPKR